MDVRIDSSWREALQDEWASPYFCELASWVRERYRDGQVFPLPDAYLPRLTHARSMT